MAAGTHDIRIEQGATFRLDAQWLDENGTPIDLTGFIGRAQVRPGERRNGRSYPDMTVEPLLVFDVTFPDPTDGRIRIEATAPDTDQDWGWDSAVWDVEIVETGGDVVRLIEGSVEFALGVS